MPASKKQTNMTGRTESSNVDSFDELLGDIDQFVKGIYRDFNIESILQHFFSKSSNSNTTSTESEDTSSQPTSSTTFRKQQSNVKESTATCDLDSVIALLENVDQFIAEVDRDIAIQAKPTKSFDVYPRSHYTLTSNLLPDTPLVDVISNPLRTSSNDRERNGDNRVSSIGYSSSATGTTRQPASPTTVNCLPIATSSQQQSCRLVGEGRNNGGKGIQRPPVAPSHFIDLSEDETHRPPGDDYEGRYNGGKGIQRPPVAPSHFIDLSKDERHRPPSDDEDVIWVETKTNPVTTPIRRQRANEMSVHGCRMTKPAGDKISVVSGLSLAKRRRVEIVFFFNTIQTLVPSNATTQIPQYNTLPQTNAAVQSDNIRPQTNNVAPSTDSHYPTFMCTVCMESSLQRQPTSTRCGHIFCNKCIRDVIRCTKKCPLCNKKTKDTHIFRIYL